MIIDCPTCEAPACKSCRGKRCKCDPQEMEIAVYCNCRMDIHEFLRMKFELFTNNPEEKRKAHENSLKNLRAWMKTDAYKKALKNSQKKALEDAMSEGEYGYGPNYEDDPDYEYIKECHFSGEHDKHIPGPGYCKWCDNGDEEE